MNDDERDTDEVRVYGSSHVLARRLVFPAAGVLLLGLATGFSGTGISLSGLALIVIGGALLAVIAVRLTEPDRTAIEFGDDGIVFRDVSSRLIPWRQIRSVEVSRVSEISAPVTREVATIAVSREFFGTLSAKTIWPQEVVSIADPTLIHLASYRRDVPVHELAATIRAKLVDTSTMHCAEHQSVPCAPTDRIPREADLSIAGPRGSDSKQHERRNFVWKLLWGGVALAAMICIFAPFFSWRETGQQARSRKIGEEHERRMRESLELSERERRRSEEDLRWYRKELFGDR